MDEERSRRINELELRLSDLAYHWRSTDEERKKQALVEEYHAVAAQMKQLGWNGSGLSPDAELPEELMPPL